VERRGTEAASTVDPAGMRRFLFALVRQEEDSSPLYPSDSFAWLLTSRCAPWRISVWGDSGSEREIAGCRLADASLIRLYHGEPGATVQDWYSVIHTPFGLSVERQIIFSYSAPEFTQLSCTPRGVALSGPGENSAVFLATSEASSMRWLPRRYGRGSAIGAERQSRITLGQVEGVVLLLIGIALLVAKSRQHRAHMAATQRTLRESGDPNGSPHSLL